MINNLRNLLERIIPVPEKGYPRHEEGILTALILPKELRLSRDADYLVYLLSRLCVTFILIISSIFLLDHIFDIGFFSNFINMSDTQASIAENFGDIIRYPLSILFILFYFRIRLSLDIACGDIPVLAHPAFFDDKVRSKWIVRSLCILIIISLVLMNFHKAVAGISHYARLDHDSPLSTVLITVAVGTCVSMVPSIAIVYALTLEKAFRYFDDFKRQLDELAKERDLETDKYKKS